MVNTSGQGLTKNKEIADERALLTAQVAALILHQIFVEPFFIPQFSSLDFCVNCSQRHYNILGLLTISCSCHYHTSVYQLIM